MTALEPGVEIVIGNEGWIIVEGNGVLQSGGTADQPVTIRGESERPGAWAGLKIRDSERNMPEHTRLLHTGNTDSLAGTFAAIDLNESKLSLSNTLISDAAGWGIRCSDPTIFSEPAEVTRGPNVVFGNFGRGEIEDSCVVR